MKIAFLLVDDPVGSPPALVMAATVRKWMPHAELVQLTGEKDEIIPGCTAQRIPRNGEPLMLYRFRHLMELEADELIALDTDIYVQSDLSKVFAFPFDVALTWRDGPVYEVSDVNKEVDLAKLMPYNSGVMFCRNRQFWRDCHAKLTALGDPEIQHWYGDQWTIADIAPRYNVLKLHCDNWNYTPGKEAEDVSTRFAVHYKGKRKPWMINRGSDDLHRTQGSGCDVAESR